MDVLVPTTFGLVTVMGTCTVRISRQIAPLPQATLSVFGEGVDVAMVAYEV